MTPGEALRFIDALEKFGIRLGLERIQRALAALGNPQERYRTVHVAGTNGKGSTSAMIAAALGASGYRTGLYTSPPLERFGERIRIDGRELDEAKIPELLERVLQIAPPADPDAAMTQFEVITAMAFDAFSREAVEAAVIEVGLGGRLDSTNVITPAVSVITNVALEHTAHLGDTPRAVAREKAGVVKPGVPVVTGAHGEALDEILAIAAERDAPAKVAGRDFILSAERDGGYRFQGARWTLEGLRCGLEGSYQGKNLALALAALETLAEAGWRISEDAARAGMENVRWAGRLERIAPPGGDGPTVLLDGAHNPHAATALADALKAGYPRERLILILGILDDKDARSIVSLLTPLAQRVLLSRSDSGRALDPGALAAAAREIAPGAEVFPALADAWRAAREGAGPGDLILFTGSLTVVSGARGLLRAEGWLT